MTSHAGLLESRSIGVGVRLDNLVPALQDVVFEPQGVRQAIPRLLEYAKGIKNQLCLDVTPAFLTTAGIP